MIFDQLQEVFKTFMPDAHLSAYEELASGHINDTYLVKTTDHSLYILQRINQGVFKDVPGLIWNKVNISNHLQQRLMHLSDKERHRRVLTFVHNQNGKPYTVDQEGNYWNLMIYIDQSKTFETVKSAEVAYEGGKLFGEFLNLTSDFDPNKLIEVIPKFHDMDFRYAQFEDSLKKASKERLASAKRYIDLVAVLKDEMHLLQKLKNTGKIKLRVTHNDTKISNALFDLNNKGLCVIDTDTVMQGIVHYDFGDAIRTICNTAAEDERDLDQVEFNKPFYQAYLKGFLEKTEATLTPVEIKYLPLGAKTMIFIMALRFLTDYLNGDIYYKTKYDDHNLDRAKNQFKLIQSFNEKMGKVS
jgi:thiamine kinase-like enzyme